MARVFCEQRLHTPGPGYYNPRLPSKQTFGQSRLATAPPRTTFSSDASTAPAVGSYNPNPLNRKSYGCAPFNSTSARESLPTFHTPAPGSYDISLATSKPCSSLCSRSARFQQSKASNPAPGSYNISPQWIKPRTAPLPPADSSSLQWERVSTAPSIPNTQYGYHVQEGNLVQIQAPLHHGYSGINNDTVGPGDYSPRILEKQSFSTANWSNYGHRWSSSNNDNEVPPIGSYDVNIGREIGRSDDKVKRVPFSQSAPRESLEGQSKSNDDVPPVGIYDTRPKWDFERPREGLTPIPIGGRSKRFNSPRESTNQNVLITIPGRTGRSLPFRSIGPIHRPGFGGNSKRFMEKKGFDLGPGQYYEQNTQESQTKSAKFGSFGLGKREIFTGDSDSVGPGKYQISKRRVKKKRKSGTLKSTCKRFTDQKHNNVPDVGHYNVKIPDFKPRKELIPFNSTTNRFK
ncbi:hypothetical protein P9112_013761 [Eukaryota sp. TZLM1-RC]